MVIKQSTAKKLPVLLYDAADFKTPKTGVVYTAITVRYQKENGSWTAKTVASGDWTELGNGLYELSFTATELDTLGLFKYQVTDNQTNFLDYNGLAVIETATNTDIKSVVDTLPTATDIDTQLTSSHGSGNWVTYSPNGQGTYNVTIHCKDGSNNDIDGVKVFVHNQSNDDSPIIANGTTDANGNVTVNLNSGTYTIRAYKTGYTFSNITPTISASGTQEMTGTLFSITPPADPDICTLYFKAHKLDNSTTTGLSIKISSQEAFTKVNGILVDNVEMTFTYDSNNDVYKFDALRNAVVKIEGTRLGLDHEYFTVPDQSTFDLGTTLTNE